MRYLYRIMDFIPEISNLTYEYQNTSQEKAELSHYHIIGHYLEDFKQFYLPIHGWVSIFVCLFGIIANILNIVVLTRKEMISPTNAILTGLAVADMFVMTTYFPYSIHNFIRNGLKPEEKYSSGWAVFTLIHAHSSIVSHTISIWLTVILAVWRYIAVSFPTDSKQWCNMSRAKCVIICIYFTCPIFCLPSYLTYTINSYPTNQTNVSLYKVGLSQIAKDNEQILVKINFWMYSVVAKLIPCLALTYLSLALIRVLYRANQRKQRLKQHGFDYNNDGQGAQHLVVTNSQNCDRTTRMLLAILLLFLITEFPSGLAALLSGILGEEFHLLIYLNLGELMDLLALINSAVNFILYCTMSRQFRKTFTKLFCTTVTIDTQTAVQRRRRQSADPFTCNTTCV